MSEALKKNTIKGCYEQVVDLQQIGFKDNEISFQTETVNGLSQIIFQCHRITSESL